MVEEQVPLILLKQMVAQVLFQVSEVYLLLVVVAENQSLLQETVVDLAVVDIEVVDRADQAIPLLLLLHKERMVELVFQDLEQVALAVVEEQALLVLMVLLIIHQLQERVELVHQQKLQGLQWLTVVAEVEAREILKAHLEELVELVVVVQEQVVDLQDKTQQLEQTTLAVAVVEL